MLPTSATESRQLLTTEVVYALRQIKHRDCGKE